MNRINNTKKSLSLVILGLFVFAGLIGVMFGLDRSPILQDDHKEILIPEIIENKPAVSVSPIEINGNAALDAYCAGQGKDGLTPENAYVIENLDIDGQGSDDALVLKNTNRFLIIRNCIIRDGSNNNFYLYNVTNLNFTGNTLFGGEFTEYGIYVDQSDFNLFANNIINRSAYGMVLYDCTLTLVHNNTIHNSTEYGIWLDESQSNLITSNWVFKGKRGIYCSYSNNITIWNNLVNNNLYGIFLFNSNNNSIDFNQLNYHTNAGILVQFSPLNNLTNNLIQLCYFGISTLTSNSTIVSGNTILNSSQLAIQWSSSSLGILLNNIIQFAGSHGIAFQSAPHNFVGNCSMFNTLSGITMQDSKNISVYLCKIQNSNGIGISADHSANITIYQSIVNTSNGFGINLGYCNGSIVNMTQVINSTNHGVYVFASWYCLILNSTFTNNKITSVYIDASRNTLVKGNIMTYITVPNQIIYVHSDCYDNVIRENSLCNASTKIKNYGINTIISDNVDLCAINTSTNTSTTTTSTTTTSTTTSSGSSSSTTTPTNSTNSSSTPSTSNTDQAPSNAAGIPGYQLSILIGISMIIISIALMRINKRVKIA